MFNSNTNSLHRDTKMKRSNLIAILVVLVASLSLSPFAFAQSSQTSYSLNMTYLTVQLTYPTEVLPGDSITVNIQATAKSRINSASLTAQIFYADTSSLHQLTSATLSSNYYMNSGSTISKQIQFTIPANAPRTSLVALLTEKVQTAYAAYYYYPRYYNYSYPYCYYYYGYYNYDCYYGYTYYPTYSYTTTTDTGVTPLSYVKATTPEYVSLQSQYQALQSQDQSLQSQLQAAQQQLAQSQAQNQQLTQNLQSQQNTLAQRDGTITSLNQQLNVIQNSNVTYKAAAVGLAIAAVIFGLVAIHESKGKNSAQQRAKAQTEMRS
jgi:hypothetical protein